MLGTRVQHYKILSKIGEGGMGEVYRALDEKLGREVALKLLPEARMGDEIRRQRFLREARAVAALQHPSIVTIYSVDDLGDMLFLTMELLAGRNLADELVAVGRMPLDRVLDVGIAVASALECAHDAGITHRDLKPANIMFDAAGRPKVLDFGLAKIVTPVESEAATRGASAEDLTDDGRVVGTTCFMAPEQLEGGVVTSRTDLFSFGMVLYETAVSVHPFLKASTTATISAILRDTPESLVKRDPSLPPQLSRIVDHCLQKEPDRRYQSASEIRSALEMLRSPSSSSVSGIMPAATPSERSIVVLPFANLSPDPKDEYFSDGLTDEIISDLSQLGKLRVISRTSSMRLKNSDKDVSTISRDLDVQYVLEGSVRKAGPNLRIMVQLIDGDRDAQLWSQKYSGKVEDVFEMQESVSRAIVEALRIQLTDDEEDRIAARPMTNMSVFDLYLRARHDIMAFEPDRLAIGLERLEKARELSGDNVHVLRGLGLAHFQYFNTGVDPSAWRLEEVEKMAMEIATLDPAGPHVPALLGLVAMQRGQSVRAVRLFRQATAIDPNDPEVLGFLGAALVFVGRPGAARPMVERLISVDPLSMVTSFLVASVEYMDGRFDRAIEPATRLVANDPENPIGQWLLGHMLAASGHHDKAIATVDALPDHDSSNPYVQMSFFMRHALAGEHDRALEVASGSIGTDMRHDLQYAQFMAGCFALIDEPAKATDWLETAISRGFINYPYLAKYDPFLEPVRGTAHFKVLMDRVKTLWDEFEREAGPSSSSVSGIFRV